MNILILGGGKSGEHEVSLVSAASIARHIDTVRHTVHLGGIAKDGRWYLLGDGELSRLRGDETAAFRISGNEQELVVRPGAGIALARGGSLAVDVVFPALHGTFGEDGTIQGLLECAGLPYVGCGVMASAVAMDKEKTKILWSHAGLPVVPWVCLCRADLDTGGMREKAAQAEARFGYPVFVKPACTGSSVGITKTKNREELEAAVLEAFTWDNKVILEKGMNAREIECSVTGNSVLDHQAVMHEAGEVVPHAEFYDYNAKYIDPDGAALLIPAPLGCAQRELIAYIARLAYAALDCSGLARVDFFLDKGSGDIYLNEINTMPGFTAISMFPKMCAAAGVAYPDLIELLLQDAVRRFRAFQSLRTDWITD
ncbi:MAG: D-alanine--D-alanine ligase [Spirochaetaceae bacterium]|jgi:D-alanine-D-alanine ligase|nr:D-alanine--D-alanine ligase [Spirochaetaceae bacterium]